MKFTISKCIFLLAALDAHAAQARAFGAEPDSAAVQLSGRAFRAGKGIPTQNGVARGRFGASPAKRDDSHLDTRAYRVGGAIPGQNEVSHGRFDAKASRTAKRQTFDLGDLLDIINGQSQVRQAESTAFPIDKASRPAKRQTFDLGDLLDIINGQSQVEPRQAESTAFPIDEAPRPVDTAVPIPDAPPAAIDTAIPNIPIEVIDTRIPVAPVPTPVVTAVPVVQVPGGFITAIRVRQNTAVNGGNAGQAGEATAVVGEPSQPIRTDFAIVANVVYE
ncbi:hypothetical protein QBC41DRAFT_287521 [Cercophora samala]|uniref:Uncharacterized protein n=1 Tax=Cercophora samala TaxID=330535 RepID=A0AA39YU42_9PEZI|nr:hypothetical protein QBC41DRAFT_287521 [Cercophora samala]